MKVIKKYFIIALLLSLIFSIGMVAAQEHQENITFEQSNIDDVSDETFTVPSEDQEVNQVEQDSSLSQGEDSDDNLGAGQTLKFSDAQTQINSASGTLYLGNILMLQIQIVQ